MAKHRPFFIPYTPRPEHDAARHLPGFETQEQAEGELTRLVRTLEAAGETDAAKALLGCRIDQRCGRAHCPVCNRHFRRWFMAAVMDLIEDLPTTPLFAVSIIPATKAREPGSLSTLSLHNAKENLRQSLTDRLPLSAWAILAWDISSNQDETKRDESFLPHWQLHLYGIIGGVSKAELKRFLHSMFPKSLAVPRPIQSRS